MQSRVQPRTANPDAADGNGLFPDAVSATLGDHPHVALGRWKVRIETVAYCVNSDRCLGSISWGFDFLDGAHAVPITPTVSGTSSASFVAAQQLFQNWNKAR